MSDWFALRDSGIRREIIQDARWIINEYKLLFDWGIAIEKKLSLATAELSALQKNYREIAKCQQTDNNRHSRIILRQELEIANLKVALADEIRKLKGKD